MDGKEKEILVLDADALESYLLGSCYFSGASFGPLSEKLNTALPWFESAVAGNLGFIPFNVFFDLGHLLTLGHTFPFASLGHYDEWPKEERSVRTEYENRFLNGVLSQPSFRQLRTILDAAEDRDPLINRIIEIILEPLQGRRRKLESGSITVLPTVLKEMKFSTEPDTAAARADFDKMIYEKLGKKDFLHTAQRQFVEQMTGTYLRGKSFTDIDFHELENFGVYRRTDARLRARAVLTLENRFGAFDPEIYERVRENESAVTAFKDAGLYPVGGFAEITTQTGSLESLVRSELVYMEEKEMQEVDLFDVRFVENELLYYKRDEGELMRRRRRLNIILDLSTDMRFAPGKGEEQVWTCVCALILRLLRDFSLMFERDAVTFRIRILAENIPEDLLNECGLLRVLLGKKIELGIASISIVPSISLAEFLETEWKPYVIIITASAAAPDTIEPDGDPLSLRGLSQLWLQIGHAFEPPMDATAFRITFDKPIWRQFKDVRNRLIRAIAEVK